jgi:hypothetical protein
MKYLFIIFCCIVYVFPSKAQNIDMKLSKTTWKNVNEAYIFSFYVKNDFFTITDYTKSAYPEGGITFYLSNFGFFNSCDLPHIDSLKESGTYYFEVDSLDFASDDEEMIKKQMNQICSELNFSVEGKDTLMTIYRSSQQQYATFKKIDSLPKNIQDYMKEKGIVLSK